MGIVVEGKAGAGRNSSCLAGRLVVGAKRPGTAKKVVTVAGHLSVYYYAPFSSDSSLSNPVAGPGYLF